ncbi:MULTISPECIES: LCP family glycopolymer transferase [unclassified Gordonia (in: high G+C Gram-positive bacteria)]|uniref:LCP family protein n=2 Tax=unclassified Gordonia (in: high G+C Gram-positive bacteria) TaxID=2657482 RepID=UPI003D8DA6BB
MNQPDPPMMRRQGPPNPPPRGPQPPPRPYQDPRGPQRPRSPQPDAATVRSAGRPGEIYHPPQAWSAVPGTHRPDDRRSGNRPPGAREYAPTQKPEPIPAEAPRPARPSHRDPDHRRSQPPPPAAPRDVKRPRRRRRWPILRILLVLLLVIVVGMVAMVFYYDSKLHRVDALVSYAGRPGDTPGTNWLIVGTDSRADLSDEQRTDLSTGDAEGARTDTIMLVHNPPDGKPLIVSLPRDLYVDIPGVGTAKINAAFNSGGAQLLVRTVENLTGLRIDHYAEVGFGGFDTLVDAVGGVDICLDQPINDPKAGPPLKKGCHRLNGRQALTLVRSRDFPQADLVRVVNQRKFLSALVSRATSPGVLLNPFRFFGFVNGAVDALVVDRHDHIWNLAALAFALRDDPITTTTPTGPAEFDGGESVLPVSENTKQFFEYLKAGKPVPEQLLDTTGGVVN